MSTSTRVFEMWELLPENIRAEFTELIDVLSESEIKTLAQKIIRPFYMLKLLFTMLSTCAKWAPHAECVNYLKQFYNSAQESNKDAIKLDPHAFFTQVYGGWGAFPVEVMKLMKQFYDSDKKKFKCLKDILDNQNVDMMSLALRPSPRGERNRKILSDNQLAKCIVAMSSNWN